MTNFGTNLENSASPNSPTIRVGDIRRAVDMELIHDSRLVVVLEHNRKDDSYVVALVSNLIEVATCQDFILSSKVTGAAFDVSVLPNSPQEFGNSKLIRVQYLGVFQEIL